ncbi:MAG: hypothetical protein JXQ73_25140 [Phycisphaerae bacterium]|nr:hypothetical protein [Phycisphaerae bacterium]
MAGTTEITDVHVTGIDQVVFDRVQRVAREAGVTTAAGAVRFALSQFVQGRSIRDFEPGASAVTTEKGGLHTGHSSTVFTNDGG